MINTLTKVYNKITFTAFHFLHNHTSLTHVPEFYKLPFFLLSTVP